MANKDIMDDFKKLLKKRKKKKKYTTNILTLHYFIFYVSLLK